MNKLTTIVAAFVLLIALAGCGDNSQSDTTGSGLGDRDANAESDSAEDGKESEPLDHDAVLMAGISSGTAITCRYIYDASELRQMEMISTNGEVSPEATIYLSGKTVYWDIPEPGGKMAHILGHEGTTYSWKVPGDGKGVKAPQDDPTADLAELTARMKKNTKDCAIYTGPASIFGPPDGITFASVSG